MTRFSLNPFAGGVLSAGHVSLEVTEHISLEGDTWEVHTAPDLGRPLALYTLSSGGRRATRWVSLLADHYAAVEMQQTRSTVSVHTVDLRFVDPQPVVQRSVPWQLLYAALGLTLTLMMSIALFVAVPDMAHEFGGPLASVGLGSLTIAFYVLCYYLATESLHFLSLNGRAATIVIAGRLGTIRRTRACVADLVTHIERAQEQYKEARQVQLRDEMREHARLLGQGAISDEQYSDAKRRILNAHE